MNQMMQREGGLAQRLRERVSTEVDLGQMLRLLWRRRLFILAWVALAVGLAWLIVSHITPIYTATAQVMIDARRSRVVDLKEVLSQLSPQMVTVFSEVEVLRSRGLAKRVADKLDLYNSPEFNPALRPVIEKNKAMQLIEDATSTLSRLLGIEKPEPVLDPAAVEARMRSSVVNTLMGRLSVSAVPQSLVIRLSVTSPDPAMAAQLANAFAEAYVTDQLEARFEAVRRATSWLNGRLDDLRQSVAEAERQVAAYRSEAGLVESRGNTVSQQRLTELSSQLILAQSRRAEQEARVAALQRIGSGGDAGTELIDSPLIQRLREQEATLAREASDLSTRYAERHPQMTKIRAEQAEVRRKIEAEVAKQAQVSRSELAVLRDREATLAAQVRKLEATINDQSQASVRLRELEREAQASRSLYEAFLSRFKETGEQEQIQQADSRIISTAEPPRAPTYPRASMLIAVAGLAGLVAGIGLVLLLEQFDNAFRNKEQLEEAIGLPVFGLVPQVRVMPGRHVESYLADRPASSFAEAFRIIWFTLKNSVAGGTPKVVLVTSSVPEEGKSLSALSLARTAANLSMRVLLIDADLRRSSVAGMLRTDGTNAFADVLAGRSKVEDAVCRDPLSQVDVLLSRAANPPAVDLMAADGLGPLIADLRTRYDLIVIDSPPTMPVADVQVLTRHADATLFCVRWNKTPRPSVQASIRTLLDADAKLAGVLLTRVNTRKHARYGYGDIGYYYGKYRGYYSG